MALDHPLNHPLGLSHSTFKFLVKPVSSTFKITQIWPFLMTSTAFTLAHTMSSWKLDYLPTDFSASFFLTSQTLYPEWSLYIVAHYPVSLLLKTLQSFPLCFQLCLSPSTASWLVLDLAPHYVLCLFFPLFILLQLLWFLQVAHVPSYSC